MHTRQERKLKNGYIHMSYADKMNGDANPTRKYFNQMLEE